MRQTNLEVKKIICVQCDKIIEVSYNSKRMYCVDCQKIRESNGGKAHIGIIKLVYVRRDE
jgi:hypothetical protein